MSDYQPYAVNRVFDQVQEQGKPVDLFKADYTGENADYYLEKYVNSPENMGNLEGLQNTLHAMGIVAPPADAINAAIYAIQGEWGNAALSVGAIIPILGDMNRARKLAKGDKWVTLFRGIRDVEDVNAIVKNERIIGNWKKTFGKFTPKYVNLPGRGYINEKRRIFDGVLGPGGKPLLTTLPSDIPFDNILFTTPRFDISEGYAIAKNGKILEFKLPKSYITQNGRNALGQRFNMKSGEYSAKSKVMKKGYPSVIFTDGLPVKYLEKVHDLGNTIIKDIVPASKATKYKPSPDIYETFKTIEKNIGK